MEINRVESYRKFCNKLWNATKFCLFRMGLVDLEGTRLQSNFVPNKSGLPTGKESLAEKWLFHKLNIAAAGVNDALERREFSEASSAAHGFFLHDLCDVFIVSSCREVNSGIAYTFRKRLNPCLRPMRNHPPKYPHKTRFILVLKVV